MQFAVMDSSTEMQEVRAAKAARRKNSSPTILPGKPMRENTLGREMNIRPGPADMPSTPENTYTAGMIITPASRATPVSITSIMDTDFPKSTSGFT